MIRISQLKLPVGHTEEELRQQAAKELRISAERISRCEIWKKSIDARKELILYVYTLDVDTGELVDGEDMALLCGMTFDQLKKTAQDALQAYFESLYKSAEQDDFYETQLERTLSPENLETVTFYRTETGALMMQATVYSLAGAQSYERMIPIPLD